MRTVTGATDRVVVVGAGLAGLATALHLTGTGRAVTVIERSNEPGGRAGVWREDGFTFDTGPVVLTMPDLLARSFASVGENMTDWLTLREVDPTYRTFHPDGTHLDIIADPQRMRDHVRDTLGPDAAGDYARYATYATDMYRLQIHDFIDRNYDSPHELLTARLLQLVAKGGFGRLGNRARRDLKNPKLRRAFTFQAMYAGLSPEKALALYAVISYMDNIAGVWVPDGGMHQIPRAMAAAAAKHGVDLRFNTSVAEVEHSSGRARAVVTEDGERIALDTVVLNPDLPIARRELLGESSRDTRRLRTSPSAVVLLAGSRARYDNLAHHNIHFGQSWGQTFAELIDRYQVMTDPSFFVSHLNRDDPTLAPAGREAYYILFPAPNERSGIDWTEFGPRYRDQMITTMQDRGYTDFDAKLTTDRLTTPADWAEQGLADGSPFAAAHTFWQTGPFRPQNIWGENVVFTGSGTRPGVGVPMVLISGRLAAERIAGPWGAGRE